MRRPTCIASAALWLGLASAGCGESTPPPPAHRRTPDKARLFGDPTLVPTRQGELARRELAQAGEIARTVEAFAGLEPLHVDVEADDPIRVTVAGRPTEVTPADVEGRIAEVVASILGPDVPYELVVSLGVRATQPPTEPRAQVFALLLAALGLGASLGITADRAWRRRRRSQRGRRTR